VVEPEGIPGSTLLLAAGIAHLADGTDPAQGVEPVARPAVLRAGRASGAWAGGFGHTCGTGGLRAKAAEPAADPGGGEPAGFGRSFPGAAEVLGEGRARRSWAWTAMISQVQSHGRRAVRRTPPIGSAIDAGSALQRGTFGTECQPRIPKQPRRPPDEPSGKSSVGQHALRQNPPRGTENRQDRTPHRRHTAVLEEGPHAAGELRAVLRTIRSSTEIHAPASRCGSKVSKWGHACDAC
jgi:hypothetical protein